MVGWERSAWSAWAILLSAAAQVVTRDQELYQEADQLVDAVRARLTAAATGAGR